MKILFTKNQYLKLLKLIYLGNWMINDIRTGKIGMEKFIEFDKSLGKFYPTAEFEESSDLEKYRDDYDEELFWDELVNRLGTRDFVEKYGEKVIEKMEFGERLDKEQPFIDMYSKEVKKHGITRLKIPEDKTRTHTH